MKGRSDAIASRLSGVSSLVVVSFGFAIFRILALLASTLVLRLFHPTYSCF